MTNATINGPPDTLVKVASHHFDNQARHRFTQLKHPAASEHLKAGPEKGRRMESGMHIFASVL